MGLLGAANKFAVIQTVQAGGKHKKAAIMNAANDKGGRCDKKESEKGGAFD